MKIKLWGVRGSCPSPLQNKEFQNKLKNAILHIAPKLRKDPELPATELLRLLPIQYKTLVGGNTTCVEVSHKDTRIILDLGTGCRSLGKSILEEHSGTANVASEKQKLYILSTHTHWDHIQGWPFFLPAYNPQYKIIFYSCMENLQERLEKQQEFSFFPAKLEDMLSTKEFHHVKVGEEFEIGDVKINTASLMHPGGCTSYRITAGDKVFVFATDVEIYPEDIVDQLERFNEHFKDANLAVLDAQYSLIDALSHKGWGHTSIFTSIDAAQQWGIQRLILTHHDPAYSDEYIWDSFREAKLNLEITKRKEIEIHLAQEGQVYKV